MYKYVLSQRTYHCPSTVPSICIHIVNILIQEGSTVYTIDSVLSTWEHIAIGDHRVTIVHSIPCTIRLFNYHSNANNGGHSE